MVFCPFCDGYGLIMKANVKGKNIRIYICDECDTMWKTEYIQENNCENFEKFMNNLGLKGLWEELTDIEKM